MQQWEYWAETLDAEGEVKKIVAALNVRGRERWELISAVPYVVSEDGDVGIGHANTWTNDYLCVYKGAAGT